MTLRFPSTNDARLPLEARRDALATAVLVAGRGMWVVKDPLTLEQHELGEEEYLLLTLLDGRASIRTLQQEYQRRFAPRTIQSAEIQAYLGRLHQAGLVVATGTGQGGALADRASERRQQRLRWSWLELLALRFRGIDPDRLLDSLHAIARPLFHPLTLLLAAGFVLAAMGLVVAKADEFVARLPTLATLFDPSNWLLLAATVAVVKIFHELGHAIVAKHFGAEVHELGVMLLVFVPTLYCDVTDIWKLPSRWQRMAVSAAGMGIEVLLAALATFVWWFSQPGIVQLLALNTMVVASIGTLLVNANPLMRYDGYYLLADLCETPNLWQRSRDASRTRASALLFRPPASTLGEPLWMAAYGGLSSLYMLLVLGAILWAAILMLEPLGLGLLARSLGVVMVASVLAGPLRQTFETLRSPIRRGRFRPVSAVAVFSLLAIGGAVVWRMPMADHAVCEAAVVPADARPLVTTLSGELQAALPPGAVVREGDVVARLANFDLQLAGERLAGEVRLAKTRVELLETLRARSAEASNELPTSRAALADAERRLAEHEQETARLAIRAPRDGAVFPPRERPAEQQTVTLARWSGTPLDRHNRLAWLEAGTTIGVVGDADCREVALAIDETDIELVAPGQAVRVQLSAVGNGILEGTIVDIAQVGAANTSSAGDALAAWVPPGPVATTRYEARVRLNDCPPDLPVDSGGRAEVQVGSVTFGAWAIRELPRCVSLAVIITLRQHEHQPRRGSEFRRRAQPVDRPAMMAIGRATAGSIVS